jgi:hypothetical protein
MIELPKSKIKSERTNPKSMVIYSQPKRGKTTILSELENCLIIDLESGTEFVNALKYNVIAESKKRDVPPIVILQELIESIKNANKEKGGYVYKFIALDTVTALEDIVLILANQMYRESPIGRNWVGNDVTTLPNGAGYRYTRLALSMVINKIEELCDTLIIVGHVKDKLVEQEGKEMNERGLDLTGKMASIVCSQVDAIGYLYRKDNQTIINFSPTQSLTCGSRCEHLKDKEVVVAESDESGNITVDWSKIFLK